MKKEHKRILTLLLAVMLFTVNPLQTFAKDTVYSSNLEKAVEMYESMYPNSEIRVVNGEIHVAIAPEDSSEQRESDVARSVAYNANGGSFHTFRAPAWYVDQNAMRPMTKVYLPKNQAMALYYAKLNPGLLDSVCEQVQDGVSNTNIIQDIQQSYGVTLTSTGIAFLASFALIATLTMIDRVGITTAMSNGTKSRLIITKTIAYGVPATTYSHWQENTISASPWEDWNPSWTVGRYIGYDWLG